MAACPPEFQLLFKERNLSLKAVTGEADKFLSARGKTLHAICAQNGGQGQKRIWKISLQPIQSVGSLSSAAALQLTTQGFRNKCAFCRLNHETKLCRKAPELPVEERRKRLLASGACFLCLVPSHIARMCSSEETCGKCGQKHHHLLCMGDRTTPIVTAQSNVEQRGAVLFQTARAVAVGLKGRKMFAF